jgi:hypothetical protein
LEVDGREEDEVFGIGEKEDGVEREGSREKIWWKRTSKEAKPIQLLSRR